MKKNKKIFLFKGTRTFNYNDKFQLISENIDATFGEGSTVFNKTITRNYDMNNVKGRNIGFTLQTQGVSTSDMSITRGHCQTCNFICKNDRLLAVYQGTNATPYYAMTDANKNISEYVDINGNIVAHFEYSPFGKITRTTGDIANRFAFRFSSEYSDTEIGLVYYNFRYYSPELGRWLSRDSIGEIGGANLYAMLGNNIIDNTDSLGHSKAKDTLDNILNAIWTALGYIVPSGEMVDTAKCSPDLFGLWIIIDQKNDTIHKGIIDPNSDDFFNAIDELNDVKSSMGPVFKENCEKCEENKK